MLTQFSQGFNSLHQVKKDFGHYYGALRTGSGSFLLLCLLGHPNIAMSMDYVHPLSQFPSSQIPASLGRFDKGNRLYTKHYSDDHPDIRVNVAETPYHPDEYCESYSQFNHYPKSPSYSDEASLGRSDNGNRLYESSYPYKYDHEYTGANVEAPYDLLEWNYDSTGANIEESSNHADGSFGYEAQFNPYHEYSSYRNDGLSYHADESFGYDSKFNPYHEYLIRRNDSLFSRSENKCNILPREAYERDCRYWLNLSRAGSNASMPPEKIFNNSLSQKSFPVQLSHAAHSHVDSTLGARYIFGDSRDVCHSQKLHDAARFRPQYQNHSLENLYPPKIRQRESHPPVSSELRGNQLIFQGRGSIPEQSQGQFYLNDPVIFQGRGSIPEQSQGPFHLNNSVILQGRCSIPQQSQGRFHLNDPVILQDPGSIPQQSQGPFHLNDPVILQDPGSIPQQSQGRFHLNNSVILQGLGSIPEPSQGQFHLNDPVILQGPGSIPQQSKGQYSLARIRFFAEVLPLKPQSLKLSLSPTGLDYLHKSLDEHFKDIENKTKQINDIKQDDAFNQPYRSEEFQNAMSRLVEEKKKLYTLAFELYELLYECTKEFERIEHSQLFSLQQKLLRFINKNFSLEIFINVACGLKNRKIFCGDQIRKSQELNLQIPHDEFKDFCTIKRQYEQYYDHLTQLCNTRPSWSSYMTIAEIDQIYEQFLRPRNFKRMHVYLDQIFKEYDKLNIEKSEYSLFLNPYDPVSREVLQSVTHKLALVAWDLNKLKSVIHIVEFLEKPILFFYHDSFKVLNANVKSNIRQIFLNKQYKGIINSLSDYKIPNGPWQADWPHILNRQDWKPNGNRKVNS